MKDEKTFSEGNNNKKKAFHLKLNKNENALEKKH